MIRNLKTAFFSALLAMAVAYPVLGLKLSTVGIKLEVHGASPAALWKVQEPPPNRPASSPIRSPPPSASTSQ